eukprot:TRINITY_DN6839_c0_g1_i3.p1 TRINITY_DN6839_c0_g1~~TRINITY_DN6839_c0_g1_i3.p1  ORF type:complete len:690 (+),score=30.47 TRINITY_DN6839_c0_g1_i3:146-2071(+)
MVKFSKQLEAQLIPEWKSAFVNYWQLKKDIKKIKNSKWKETESVKADLQGPGVPIFGRIKGVAGSWLAQNADAEHHVIKVRGSPKSGLKGHDMYETEVLEPLGEANSAKEFFAHLDAELNKVNNFYRSKETEFIERGETLRNQLQVLLDLKSLLREHRSLRRDSSNSISISNSNSSSDVASSLPLQPPPTVPTFPDGATEEDAQEARDSRSPDRADVVGTDSPVRPPTGRPKSKKEAIKACAGKPGKPGSGRIGVGRMMRLEIPATNPSRTVSAITQMIWEDIVNQSNSNNSNKEHSPTTYINKKKAQHAEKMIRTAYVELYRGLGLLKTYSSLNMVAFGKILKKFDKVSGQKAAAVYLKTVESSYFNSSDKVIKLTDEIELSFTKHFAEEDRKKAMKFLKPVEKKDSHAVTFFIGLFTGCFIALFVGYAILAHLSGMYTDPSHTAYIETIYPVFSAFALFNLHIFLYGCNIFSWRSTRINYTFIFEFSPRKELKYREVFLICSTFMTIVVGAMIAHLTLNAKGFSPTEIDGIPGILLLAFVCILFCPLNILYRSTRFCFLKVMRNIILAPLYKVVMTDFFMADQLTSQIPLLRHMEFITCYYWAGSFKTHEYATCSRSSSYRRMAYVISFLPYYWRAMQQ